MSLSRCLLLGVGLSATAGCVESGGAGPGPGGGAEALAAEALAAEAPADDVPGHELAKQVEGLLAGPGSKCKTCHTLTRQTVRGWGEAMQAVESACIKQPGLTPLQRVDCLRTTPGSSTSPFSAHRLGLYAVGATSPQFGQLFAAAYGGPEQGRAQHTTFAKKVGMPLGGPAMPAADFAAVKSWVLRGMPSIDSVFGTSINPDPVCNEGVSSPDLLDHIALMKTEGWGARLADLATPMFGCGAATSPLGCLASLPDVTAAYAEPSVVQKVRQLYTHNGQSIFWVRSSSDGRYFGFATNGARIVDLAQPAKQIAVNASYDPYFFPSNDGFSFAGSGLRACRQSLIGDVAGQPSPSISMNEPKCSLITGGTYQSIGSSLDGVSYFVTLGSHQVDIGGYGTISPPSAQFGEGASTDFIPMVNDGQAYQVGTPATVNLPGEGDAMLSPSNLLVATRFERSNGQSAYRVRFVKTEGSGPGLTVKTPLAAQVCMPGGKPSLSFNERFLVTHQYVDHADPEQASLPLGSSNVVIADLKTGLRARITKMPAGAYALFPHFRADGWLYYLVRDESAGREYLVATDVALRTAG